MVSTKPPEVPIYDLQLKNLNDQIRSDIIFASIMSEMQK